jgi:hypothetical protein
MLLRGCEGLPTGSSEASSAMLHGKRVKKQNIVIRIPEREKGNESGSAASSNLEIW